MSRFASVVWVVIGLCGLVGISVTNFQIISSLRDENEAFKQQLAAAKLDAGKPINALDLLPGHYRRVEDKSYAFVQMVQDDRELPVIAIRREEFPVPAFFSVGSADANWEKNLGRVIK